MAAGIEQQIWFGASVDVASTSREGWTFVTGEEMTFEDWGYDQPKGDGACASFWCGERHNCQWNDSPCTDSLHYKIFICEY